MKKYVLTEWRKKRYQNHERGTLEGKEQASWSKSEGKCQADPESLREDGVLLTYKEAK